MSAESPVFSSRIWTVGALCRAVADALDARFNPVEVRGEISGFSRAVSGHCYFSVKDATGQIRCAMFKRAEGMLDFSPKDGELVELRGRLGVYEARGDLQLVVESMRRAGQGALFEQFLRLKAQLESEGSNLVFEEIPERLDQFEGQTWPCSNDQIVIVHGFAIYQMDTVTIRVNPFGGKCNKINSLFIQIGTQAK